MPSTLFDLFVLKKIVLNVQPHRTIHLCLHVLCMQRSEKKQNSRVITWVRIRQVLTLREVE